MPPRRAARKSPPVNVQPNALFTSDNLYVLNGMNSGSVDLIYLDPPFNSKRTYEAPLGSRAAGTRFKDIWTWRDVDEGCLEVLFRTYPVMVQFIATIGTIHGRPMMSYITYMAMRLVEMHRVLKDTGSLYLHCDQTASHYLKLILDRIFGKHNFRNEIIWCYTGPGNTKRWFPRKHDTVLFYVKNDRQAVFHPDAVRIPYVKLDTGRTSGIFQQAATLDEKGKVPEDWWEEKRDGMTPVGRLKKERTGFKTQKPLSLLHRIIAASTREGDVVLDPFCGCATTCVAAQQLNRKWIGIDIEEETARLVRERLEDANGLFNDFDHWVGEKYLPHRTDEEVVDVGKPKTRQEIRARLYKDQKGKCLACSPPWDIELQDLHLDHIKPYSKGGANSYENYQLLCMTCNTRKRDHSMEYLLARNKKLSEEGIERVYRDIHAPQKTAGRGKARGATA